ncbi:Rad60-SLD domain-containing protein [Rhizoctonia solani]|uniref:Rad60-SLD domain-containing protein n=2 Tax=Rhizoctonia solani TaxID=456999 RepID=A0A8H8P741_9AGAM|nr:Rad60-SLD domain-containing protein [Rhizoctonia solani]QRW26485.1 Rad60-SLD domain-containing protein [Rhizoctonia solani]
MSKSKLNSRKDKPLESVSAPLDDDSDDEFNAAALVAETEAAYKPQKRGARGRRRTIDNREKANRKDVLEAMIGDPLPQLLGLIEPGPGCAGQIKLTDSWASVSVQQDVVSGKELSSFASTQDEDTATESEDDLPTATGGVLGKRPGKPAPSSPQKRPRPCVSLQKTPIPFTSQKKKSKSFGNSAKSYIPKTPVLEFVKPPFPPPTHQQHLGPLPLKSPVQGHNVEVPASINRHLREYQRVGVRFFHQRWAESRGGLVGDDMGLGKTIQTIAFLSAAFQKSGTASDATRRRDRVRALQDEGLARSDLPSANKKWPTCLVVCPKTVVGNWVKELNTWAYFEYAVYGGDKSEREDCLRDFVMGRLDLVIMAFDTARMNIDHLFHLPWSIVIVDEVHRCKNPNSGEQPFKMAIKNFGRSLTGVAQDGSGPHRNGKTLLVCHWLKDKPIGPHRRRFQRLDKLLADRLVNNLLPYFFLRRTKALIADQMPRKFDQAVFCPLAKTQLEVYKRFLDSPDVQLMVRKDDLCDCGSEEKRGYCCYTHNAQGVHWKDLVLKYMNLFVEISNHVILIFPGFKGETDEQRARRREYVKIAFPGQAVRQADMMYGDELCGKWQVLSQLLDTWKMEGDNKVLIFSKSVKILEMLEGQLQRKNLNFCCMDGKTKQEDRMRSLNKFNNDPEVFVFLISTLVGGTGLNMTSANKVVIFDPNWNPAHDLQAMDRAYRFGQKRDVNVYRLLGAGALEELIYARQIYKQQQMHIGYEASVQTRYFEGVQGSKSHQGELFGLKNIFKLHETALATKMIIEKANLAEMNWALANMDSTPDGTIKEHTASAERNLVDFMLDDSPPTSQADRISDILNNAGVAYTHDHQNVLLASHVERNITSVAIAGSKREDGEAGVTLANEGAPEKKPPPIWPPRRKTTAPVDSAPRLEARVEALVEMGLIQSRNSLASFGRDFALMPEAEQRRILTKADRLSARKQLSRSPPFDY